MTTDTGVTCEDLAPRASILRIIRTTVSSLQTVEILVIQAPDPVDPRLAAVPEYLQGIESKCHGEQNREFRLAKATWVHVLRISSHERLGD
jgi:hypothetical protein